MPKSLSEITAAVTGAASGIGLECAKILLRQGARVVLVDCAEELLHERCVELGPNAFPLTIDLLDSQSVAGMM